MDSDIKGWVGDALGTLSSQLFTQLTQGDDSSHRAEEKTRSESKALMTVLGRDITGTSNAVEQFADILEQFKRVSDDMTAVDAAVKHVSDIEREILKTVGGSLNSLSGDRDKE